MITELGNVPAGVFNYQVFFQNCPSCTTASSARATACRSAPVSAVTTPR